MSDEQKWRFGVFFIFYTPFIPKAVYFSYVLVFFTVNGRV